MNMLLPMSPPDISIVIVTWNGKRFALECLASLATAKAVSLEIIVVDNASTDGTPEAIRTQFPGVRLILNDSNLGFAKANNIGLAVARGRYVCLVNSDVVVSPSCLETMLEYMERSPDIGLLGPKMVAPDGSTGRICDASANGMEHPLLLSWPARSRSEVETVRGIPDERLRVRFN